MDKKIRDEIVRTLEGTSGISRRDLCTRVMNTLGDIDVNLVAELFQMKDERLVTMMEVPGINPHSDLATFRLTSSGAWGSAPFLKRVQKYMRDNWIAIVALVISLIALFKN